MCNTSNKNRFERRIMDFYYIKERSAKNGVVEVYPDFKVGRCSDLMIRGKSFYAVYDHSKEIWTTDEFEIQRLVDGDLYSHRDDLATRTDATIKVKSMSQFSNGTWSSYKAYINQMSDNAHQLDTKITFANTKIKKKDYVSKRLPYSLDKGDNSAYEEIMSTLYDDQERDKLEWAVGSIVSGDSINIQKFIVLYGSAGAGKSTFLNIIQQLFEGYYTTFEAKALVSSNNQFSAEVFKNNPLVAIQHDGDLSRIEDNTKLNSIVSHEDMVMNEKHKPTY
ncbi:MAG: DUF5906 domain-containing protein, partial [Lentisphaeria bacterium]